jgi:hypothetical protein
MRPSVLRPFTRMAAGIFARCVGPHDPDRRAGSAVCLMSLGAAASVLCGLTACVSGSGPEIPGALILKRIPGIGDSVSEKISPVIAGLADGRILAAWASHVPELEQAWKTDWMWFDAQGRLAGGSFDRVPNPGRIRKTALATGAEEGAVIASIVEFAPGTAPEIHVREFRKGGDQIEPGVISLPGVTAIGDISLLALDGENLVLAVRGSQNSRPAIWIGRFGRSGVPVGEVFSHVPGEGITLIEQPLVSPIQGGGWAGYWIEERGNLPLSIVSQAFSADGKPAGPMHGTGVSCAGAPVFGVLPLLPYGDGRILVLPRAITPSCAYTVGPEGDSLKHPDRITSLNAYRPMARGRPGTNAFIALADGSPNPEGEIELLDSALTVIRRRTFPRGFNQQLALSRTASGRIAMLDLKAPYPGNSRLGFLLMDPRWE